MSDSRQPIVMVSPAKLNVFLEVLGRRADGHHDLLTVMVRTTLCDRLSFLPGGDDSVRVSLSDSTPADIRDGFPLDERNLIVRAAEALRRETGCRAGCEVQVEKRIPPESGLAGGSSNAAVTLRALNTLWNLQLPEPRLQDIAATLGSDINFLLSGARVALCRGRGEIVEPVPVGRRLHFVATRPAEGNSTPAVFAEWTPPAAVRSADQTLQWLQDPSVPAESACFNRLTTAARQINPSMANLMDALLAQLQRPVFMSGSGSTVFVVARDAEDAAAMQRQMKQITTRPVWGLEC